MNTMPDEPDPGIDLPSPTVDLRKRAPSTQPAAARVASTSPMRVEVPAPLVFNPPDPPVMQPQVRAVAIGAAAAVVVLLVFLLSNIESSPKTSEPPSSVADLENRMGTTQRNPHQVAVSMCATTPRFTVTDARGVGNDLELTVTATAGCSQGDILSALTRITVGTPSAPVAAGMIDFAATPLALPPADRGPIRQHVRFPPGTYWRTPDLLGSLSSLGVSLNRLGSTTITSSRTADAPTTITVAPATDIDTEALALGALQALADADRLVVTRELTDRWVPQISSKQLGTVAEGRTWTHADILQDHLQMRLRYPNVRLLWSTMWSTFKPDYWVTVTGIAEPSPADALGWCSGNQLDREHCYAKLISSTHPMDGSTVFQPA